MTVQNFQILKSEMAEIQLQNLVTLVLFKDFYTR